MASSLRRLGHRGRRWGGGRGDRLLVGARMRSPSAAGGDHLRRLESRVWHLTMGVSSIAHQTFVEGLRTFRRDSTRLTGCVSEEHDKERLVDPLCPSRAAACIAYRDWSTGTMVIVQSLTDQSMEAT